MTEVFLTFEFHSVLEYEDLKYLTLFLVFDGYMDR